MQGNTERGILNKKTILIEPHRAYMSPMLGVRDDV